MNTIQRLNISIEPAQIDRINDLNVRVSCVVDGQTFHTVDRISRDDLVSNFDTLMFHAAARIRAIIQQPALQTAQETIARMTQESDDERRRRLAWQRADREWGRAEWHPLMIGADWAAQTEDATPQPEQPQQGQAAPQRINPF